jgi:hypothetical protein
MIGIVAIVGTAGTLVLQANAPSAPIPDPAAPDLSSESCPLAWDVTPPDTVLALFARASVYVPQARQREIDLSYTDAAGHNVVHWAVRTDDQYIIESLMMGGAPADLPDVDGATPLMVAAGRADAGHLELLLRKGANPAAANAAGQTPLMYLAASCEFVPDPASDTIPHGLERALVQLLSAGVDLDAQDRRGHTALMHATRGSGQRVRDLLVAGADPYRVDRNGKTALDIAAYGPYSPDNEYIVALLKRAMDAGGWSGVPLEDRARYLAGVGVGESHNELDHPYRPRELQVDSVFILPYRDAAA